MSNKAISVYAEAMKRQQEGKEHSPTPQGLSVERNEKVHTPKQERTQAQTDTRVRAPIHERVRKAVVNRRRLGGFTFRYRTEELDQLDALVNRINRDQGGKVSKNDVVRIALNWLLEDFDENKGESVLAQVLKRLRE